MTTETKSYVEQVIDIDRELRPDLWKRIDGVASIIYPEYFAEGYTVHPEEAAKLHESRRNYMQAVARRKAHEILEYLGFNTHTDWDIILEQMAERSR